MVKPITVSFRWTAKEMLHAQRLYMRYSKQGRRFSWIFKGFGWLLVVLSIAVCLRGRAYIASAVPTFFLGGLFLSVPLLTRRAVLKMYKQLPERDLVVTHEITSERIRTSSEVSTVELLWRAILRVDRVPDGFLLYPTDRTFQWLPVQGFQDPADVERFAELAKANAQEYNHQP